jgi:hypothetical protein
LNDENLNSLANALSNNSRLRVLDLSVCRGITPVGWDDLVDVLHNTDSALELLDLSHSLFCRRVCQQQHIERIDV